jgi:aryl-alcohol dehydrogenase-like predicted oxidoreductase
MEQPHQDAATTSATDRREFLAQAAAVAAGATVLAGAAGSPSSAAPSSTGPNTRPNAIPQRAFGKASDKVSILGLGGYTLGQSPSYDVAEQIVREALDAGVTFFDNAWEYHQGKSEEWMGKALKGNRDKVFLMTKVCTHGRDKKVAMRQLEDSLKRLQTDHLDLWQVHEVIYYNDPELIYARDGVLDALSEAKKQGKVRFVGFTGHKDPAIHLDMLSRGYPFDAVQMPLNCFDATFRSFEKQVLPEVLKRGMAALGMKSMGGGGEPLLQGAVLPEDALRYAMSLPVTVTISGIDAVSVLRQNLAVARGFSPMSETQMQALRDRCAAVAADGHLELYKSTMKYDADVGREQHGYQPPKELPL